ncbi:hypothetical protein BJG93_36685 (plasmid) [Paraburkholderia sprentiae WSM5005]|uniref:Uncharacterized protein n=1 Tax=Paraburkholderia sprentiae WSM5005 TaxID=754502 RepID=A0A8F4QI62_9BURK|nr:hypothetical protein BJG93_35985 [Paraburkholderia sprentiae WSM5005]QXE07389.1 hypothetical protein BJG93_36685 [Paraburkholderia sprentiae WSM5005]
MRSVINDNASAEQVTLIGLLSPIIDGWSNCHRCLVSKQYIAQSTLPSGRRCESGAAGGIRARAHDGSERDTSIVKERGTGYCPRYW